MPWYDRFNFVEACLWAVVAFAIPMRAKATSRQQRVAVILGSVAFLAFGATDLLEIGRAGHLPVWLWACKVACGAAILSARYTWRGWRTFHWRDREFLFALACLAAVALVIVVQRRAETNSTIGSRSDCVPLPRIGRAVSVTTRSPVSPRIVLQYSTCSIIIRRASCMAVVQSSARAFSTISSSHSFSASVIADSA